MPISANDPYNNSIDPLTGLTPSPREQERAIRTEQEQFETKPKKSKKKKPTKITNSQLDWDRFAKNTLQTDPKTGMPLRAEQIRTPELVRQRTQSDPSTTTNSNIDVEEYKDYTDVYAGLSQEELDNRRAEGQAWYEQAGKASARVVVNGALDVVGGLASMIDIEDYANQDDEVGNWLTNLTEEGKQAFNELTPIYRKNPGEAMDVSDSGWWFENGSTLLASIGSFAAQGYIVAATLGAGSAGLVRNASALVQKLAKAGVTGLTAMGMNQAESIMSAAPVYKENYTKYLQQGMDETKARQKAADDASTVINMNRANVLLNLSSASMFTRSGNQILSRELLKEPAKLLTKKGIGSLALEGGQEMLEEQINYISEKAGKNNTGLSTGDYLGLNAKRIAQDPHFWEAGALGAIGGIGQTVGSTLVNRKDRAKQLEQYMLQQGKIADIESGTGIPVSDFMLNAEKQKEFGVKMRTLETELDQARKDNNEAEVAKLSTQISAENSKQLFHQTMTSLNSGTTGVFLDSLKKFNNLTSEEATAKGLPEDYQERTQKAIDFVSSMENTFNEHALKDPNVRNQLVINRGEHHIVKNTINTIQSKIDEQNKKISEVRALLPTAQQGMSDEALANENATVREALAEKVQLEREHDGAWNYSNKLDSELDAYLKENYTQRSAKKIKSREEALNDRSRDGFKEMVRMAMMSDPEFGKEELMEIRSTLEGISDSPLQASHMSWLDELIQQQNEFEAGTKQKATLKSNAKDNVVNNSQEIKDALGVDDDTINKLAAQTHSNEGEMEDADSSPVKSLSDALADAGKAQGPTVLNSLDADDVASLSDDAKSVLSENDMTAQELGSYVNALEEEGTVFNEDEQALIEEHIKQLQAKDELAQKEIEEQLETGTSIDATLSWVLNDATDKTLDPDYKETPDPVKSSDPTVEAGKEAVIKHSNIRPLRPEGAVSTRDSQFISHPIAKPKYQDVDIVFNDKTRGLYVQLLDENGNPIRQSATHSVIKLELTEEEKAHAIPVYWNPIKKNPTDKSLIMKKSTEFGFEYVYDRSQITPLRVNGMEGRPLFLVHDDPNNIIYEDEVLDFKSWNSASSNPGVGKKVYLKKGQYVDKEGKQLWVNKDGYKDEVITVHLTPDGPPVQKIESGDTELRREFENLMKDGHVEVEIGFINRGRILNNKNQGKSVEYPISALGELGKDYYLGMGNNDKQIIYTDEMDNSFTHEEALGDVESGRVYAMVRGANGELFPVRLETKNISKDHANKIIDNILLSDNAGTEVQKIMKTVMALDGKKNIEDAEVRRNKTGERMPVDSIFFVNSHSIKIKIGDQIVGIQFGDNVQSYGTYNNLKQALEGKPFKLVQYHSQDKKDANGNHLYGTPVMIDSAKAGKKVPKVISSEELAGDGVEDALNNFREVLVKAIMSRKYQVSKASLASKLEFDSALTGKSYGTYAAYLNDMQIVSTDVSASQLFYGAKADLMPVAIKRSVPVAPITATQSTTTMDSQKADIEKVIELQKEKVLSAKNKEELIKAAETLIGMNPYDSGAVSMATRAALMTPGSFERGKELFLDEIKRTIDQKIKAELAALNQTAQSTTEIKAKEERKKTNVISNEEKLLRIELDKATRATEREIAQAEKQIINPADNPVFTGPVKYMLAPLSNGTFKTTQVSDEPVFGNSLYKLTIDSTNPNRATYEFFSTDKNTLAYALAFPDEALDRVSDSLNLRTDASSTNPSVIVVQRGIVQKKGDSWVVVQPQKIAFGSTSDSADKFIKQNSQETVDLLKKEAAKKLENITKEIEQAQQLFSTSSQQTEPAPISPIDSVNSNISEVVEAPVVTTPVIPDVLTTELTPEQQNDAENIDDFRVAENGFESNPGNILTETELNWILETYGEEHVETIALAKYITIKGVDAYGAYSNGLVRLADMGAKGTAYHEAFHLVYDLALTENQKTTLIANAKKEFKAPTIEELNTLASRYPKFTSDEIETKYYEEQLSEGLREMMEAEESAGRLPKTKFGKAIQKFYDLIRKAILNIRIAGTKLINPDSIYLSSLIIKRQFLGIKTGEFKISEETKKHIKENPTNITSLRSKKGYSELAKIDILNSLRNVLFTKVIPDMLKQTTGLPKTTEAKNVQDLLLKPEFKADLLTAIEQVKERLQVYVAKNKASNNEANIIAATNVETALMDQNWNDTTTDEGFKTLLIKSLKLHGASVRKLRATKDFTEEDWNEYASQLLTFGEEQMDSEGDENETSKERIHDQHFALSDPKKTLSFEVKTALSFIPYGRSAITNLPLFIDFHRVYAMLKGKLADVDTTEMEERLIAIAAFNPEVEAVLKAYNEWSETTKAAFKAAMSGTQLKMSTVIVTGDKFEVIETNRSGLLKQITNEWKLNQNQRKLFTEQKDGSFTVNKDVLQVMGTKYAEMMKITEANDFYNAVNEVFEYVGISFSPDILQTLNKKYPVEVFKKEQIGKYFKPIIESLGYKASTNKLTSSPGADPYVSAEGGKGQLKNIGRIAELIKDLRVDAYAGTFTNGEGKMIYSINLNSYISKFGAKLSTVEGIAQLRDTFKKDVYYYPDGTEVYGSILLETLYKSSKAREEFDIIEFDSMKEGRGAEALTFDTTTDKQTTLSRLALYDNNGNAGATGFGYINMGTKSDKGRLLAMKVPLLNSKHGIELLNKNTGDSFDIARVKQAAVKVLTRNAMQEFFRIKRTEEQLFGDTKLEDYQLIENLHFKGNYDRTKANGLYFLSIPDLNFDQYGLFKMNDNNERRLVNITPAIVAKIEEAIGEFVDREITRGKEAMVEMGVLFKYEDAYYSKELPAFFGPRKSVSGVDSDNIRLVDDRISEYLMNELVWNTEINKYQMGDLALYKTPKNEVKIDDNPEFKGKTGYWYSVVTDAGKRSYQAITPGLDHVIKTMVSGYGKSSTMNMLVVKDIISKVSVKRTLNYMSGLAPGTWAVNPAKLLELAEKIDATKDKTEASKLKTELTNLLETLTPKQKEAYRIAKGYRDGVNSADAQGYTSLDAHKESMQSRGMWTMGEGETHEQAEVFWRTESDYNKWPDFAKKLVLKPLKTFYFGSKFDPILNMMVFTQIKHATTPLYPAFTKNVPELEVLRNRVEATGEFEGLPKIDVVNLESAVKVGKTSTIEYTSGNSEYLKNPKSVQTIDSANERAPFILPTDSSDDQKDGSQFVKLITADMNDGAEYTTVEGFEKITTQAIKSLNNTLYAEKIRRSADQLAKQLGLDEYYANPHDRQSQLKFLYNLKELLEEQIESRDLPDNYSIALEIQNLETKYSYAMPLSFPAYAKKFEIAMAALYKSRVLTQKLPGGAAVQIAEYGIAENKLKYYRFDAEGNLLPAECAISYKQAEKMGISQYFSKDGEIDLTKVPNPDDLNILGYRIPSSAKNSFLPLRVKRLLPPTAKGQIMLPHEIVLQTGADYDVDKMYLYYPEFSKNKEGKYFKSPFKKSLKALHDGKKDVSEFTDKEITNSLFALRWGILTSKHHAAEVMDPLDSSTFANKLEEYTRRGLADDTSTYNFSSFYTGIHLEMINKAAKLLVGLFSSHSVAHAISQDIDIVTEVPIQIEVQGADGVLYPDSGVSLSKQRGFDGVLISKYISECQNAALDNAKDPLTGSLNITDFTGNVVSYFNRLGYNNEITTDFINQPIIRALSQLKNNSEGFFVSDFAAELIEKLKLPTKHADGKEIQYGKSRTLKVTPTSLSNMLGKDLTEMSEDELRDQVQILIDFVEYHGAGSHLAKANKVLAPDRFVKMSGLSDIEIWENNRRFIESGNAKIQISNVYAPDGSGKVNSHPRLDAYHRHAIMGAQNLISVFMPFNESYFTKIKDTIAEMVHQRDGIIDDKALIETLNNGIYSFELFKSESPISKYFDGTTKEKLTRKFFNSASSFAANVDDYKKKYNLGKNPFLKMISSDSFNSRNTFQMLAFNNAASYSSDTKNTFVDAFEELIKYPERVVKEVYNVNTKKYEAIKPENIAEAVAEVQALTKNILQYVIYSSGFQSGPNSFIDLVPISFWKSMFQTEAGGAAGSLSMYINKFVENTKAKFVSTTDNPVDGATEIENQLENTIEQVIRNIYLTPKLLKSVKLQDVPFRDKTEYSVSTKTKGTSLKFPSKFSVNSTKQSGLFTKATEKGKFSGFPKFIKAYDTDNKEWRLYKLESEFIVKGGQKGNATYKLEAPLGETGKFFEVYPTEKNPTSVHPNNNFQVMEAQAPKIAKKETVQKPVTEEVATEIENVPSLSDIIPTTAEVSEIAAQLSVSEDIPELEDQGLMDINDLLSQLSATEQEVIKKKMEDGDTNITCGNG